MIQPGFIETKMTAAIKSLLRREGRAEEIGYKALFLASEESSYITGTDIVVDGGWVTAAPYLSGHRRHHMLQILRAKDAAKDKREAVEEFLRRHLQRCTFDCPHPVGRGLRLDSDCAPPPVSGPRCSGMGWEPVSK